MNKYYNTYSETSRVVNQRVTGIQKQKNLKNCATNKQISQKITICRQMLNYR